jgi:dTDP-4-amino-4,6-dideoxygalactose transaminase
MLPNKLTDVKEVIMMDRIVPKPILKSEFREDIDNMLENGNTYTEISNWLSNHGENISRQVISKYHKFGFNVNVKAVEKYIEEDKKSLERLDKAATKQSDTLRLYDKFIAAALEVNPDLLDERTRVEVAVKMAKQREDFMREHGDSAIEEMTREIEDLRAQIRDMDLLNVIRGMSDDRTAKRLKASNNS